MADIVYVGDPAEIQAAAEKYGLDIAGIRIVDINNEVYKAELLDKYEAMPEKVMTRKFVAKRIGDPLYLATLLEAVGEADGTLAGIDTTTYEFVLAANSIIGMEPGCPTASGLLILEVPDLTASRATASACQTEPSASSLQWSSMPASLSLPARPLRR